MITSDRFRTCFFDYGKDFNGKHFFGFDKFGYLYNNQKITLPGWILSYNNYPLVAYLEVLQDGICIHKQDINFVSSPDVQKAFPSEKNTENCRFSIAVDLNLLDKGDYVLRLVIIDGDNTKQKLWDIALIHDTETILPIFVVGSPRAGTTAIGNAIRVSLKAKNYGEHHFLLLANNLNNTVKDYFTNYHTRNDKGTFINDISPALVIGKITQQIKAIYGSWHTGSYFVDKTPGRNMLNSLPVIQILWPEAKFIFCKRRAYENIRSRLVKFPHLDVKEHANQWVEVMQSWEEVKKMINKDNYIEIDQVNTSDPNVMSQFKEWWGESVANNIASYLSKERPQTSNYTHDKSSENDINKAIYELCGNEMKRFGYSVKLDEYFS